MESRDLISHAGNPFQDACGPDGMIAPVDPSDLKGVLKKQQELATEFPGQNISIGRDIFAEVCTPGANVAAAWYRVGILGMLGSVKLLPANLPTEVEDAMFRVMARFPIRQMELGVVYEGLPLDVEAFVKQLERELIGR